MFLGKNKHFIKFITAMTAVSILMGSMPLSVKAASFSHVHSGACYRYVTKTCSNHTWAHGRETLYRQCPTCRTTTTCVYNTYKDCCPNGLREPVYKRWDVYCATCGTMIEQRDGELEIHTYEVLEIQCGMSESTTAATVSVSNNQSGWTNGTVTISCSVNVSDPTFSVAGYSFNGGGYSGSSSAEVSENGNYSFTVIDNQGRTVSESVTVSNIDKTAPTVTLSKSTDEWTEEGLTITAAASDDQSGLAAEAYSFGGAYSSSNSMHVTKNGTYSVTVMDNAGNTSSASITISNIGRDPKVIAEEQRKKEEEQRALEAQQKQAEQQRLEESRRKEEEQKKQEESRKIAEEEKRQKEALEQNNNESEKNTESGKNDGTKKNSLVAESDKNNKDGSNSGKKGNSDSKENAGPKTGAETEKSGTEHSDVSEKDVSGNLIPVNTDLTGGDKVNKWVEKTSETVESNPIKETTLWTKLLNMDATGSLLAFGFSLILLAVLVFFTLDFVYSKKDGKFTPISLAKVESDKKRLLVKVPKGVLVRDKKYIIFLSPISRLRKRGKSISVEVDGHNQQNISSNGCSFVYTG